MPNVLEQAIDCEDGERAAKIIQDALGIENSDDMTKPGFGEPWPADRKRRGRIIGKWLRTEATLQADRSREKMAGLQNPPTRAPDEHEPSCFALEEERGENWKGGGALQSNKEAKPSL